MGIYGNTTPTNLKEDSMKTLYSFRSVHMSCASQCSCPLLTGGGCGGRALGDRHCITGRLCATTATTDQEEEDCAAPPAGERGERGCW